MAEKRMFAKTIIDSDAFCDMPLSTQALYFHLSMRADDDGFLNSAKKIQRMVGCSDDDMRILIAKRFIITFESGVIVIKHWRINNYIRVDRYKPTMYEKEKALLYVKPNGAYTLNADSGVPLATISVTKLLPSGIPDGIPSGIPSDNQGIPDDNHVVYQMETQYRLDKNSIDKSSIDNSKSITPLPDSDDLSFIGSPTKVGSPKKKVDEPIFIELVLNDGQTYGVPVKDVAEYKKLYPAVNVEQELRNMAGWCMANEKNRKTKTGIKRFINSWLSREQNKGGWGRRINSVADVQNIGKNGIEVTPIPSTDLDSVFGEG